MQNNSWLLPDGIVELTGQSAQQLEHIRRSVLDLYRQWGYSLIFPPLVEFLDSLIAGGGEELALQTFKLTDQVSGRMLGVRADITPQVARHDAYHNNGGVSRFCYAGSVLHTKPTHILANRSLIQAGAELYGHNGVASDLEILELMLASLAVCDQPASVTAPPPWTLTIGHAAITRALLAKTAIPEQDQARVYSALKTRSEPDLMDRARELHLSDQQLTALINLANLCGDESTLQRVSQQLPEHEKECEALQNLQATCKKNYPGIHWFFDFSWINNYAYETGIIFHATHAQGAEPLARGGRYDELSRIYGAQRPAVGFSCDLLALARTLDTSVATVKIQRIWAPSFANFTDPVMQQSLRAAVSELRSADHAVTTSVHAQSWQDLDSSIQEKYDGYLKYIDDNSNGSSHWQVTPNK